MQTKIILTKEGVSKIRKRLKTLEEKERKKVADAIREAQSFGDIAENSEFEEARNQQELLEQEIAELKYIISQARIVANHNYKNKITVGSKVKIKINQKEEIYEIVGDREANPLTHKISFRSPLGQAMLGKTKGAKTKIFTPKGLKNIEILEIL